MTSYMQHCTCGLVMITVSTTKSKQDQKKTHVPWEELVIVNNIISKSVQYQISYQNLLMLNRAHDLVSFTQRDLRINNFCWCCFSWHTVGFIIHCFHNFTITTIL